MTRKLFVDERLDEEGELFLCFIDDQENYISRIEAAELIIRMVYLFKFEPEEIMYMDEAHEKQEKQKRNTAKCGRETSYDKGSE